MFIEVRIVVASELHIEKKKGKKELPAVWKLCILR